MISNTVEMPETQGFSRVNAPKKGKTLQKCITSDARGWKRKSQKQ